MPFVYGDVAFGGSFVFVKYTPLLRGFWGFEGESRSAVENFSPMGLHHVAIMRIFASAAAL